VARRRWPWLLAGTAVLGLVPLLALGSATWQQALGPDGIANTKDDLPAPDLAIAISRLGINGNPQQLATLLSVTSGTRRIISSARVGNLTRQLGIVVQGAPGQTGVGAILWMAER
jgi:hypothetical protein